MVSERRLRRSLLMAIKAVSEPEKKAEQKSRTASTTNMAAAFVISIDEPL